MRLIARMLDGDTTEWVTLAKSPLVSWFHRKRHNQSKCLAAGEILLLEQLGRLSNSKTLSNILQGWKSCRYLPVRVKAPGGLYPELVPMKLRIKWADKLGGMARARCSAADPAALLALVLFIGHSRMA
ncbi:hypothetical protein R1flu_027569 [Riccia fluitans]|uniref:Transposase n=1 Tax=Riccia fluitans TaxID=41844 RepID=A0ABD1XM55_9MARC